MLVPVVTLVPTCRTPFRRAVGRDRKKMDPTLARTHVRNPCTDLLDIRNKELAGDTPIALGQDIAARRGRRRSLHFH